MRKHSVQYILLFFSVAIVIFTSCTPESCFEETESFLKASFYSSATGKTQAPDSLTVLGIGKDAGIIYSAVNPGTVARLPLNPLAESTTFVMLINSTADTVTFFHNSYLHLISKKCGYTFYHNIDANRTRFTGNTIDSIRTIKNTVTIVNEENFRIFY